MQFNMSKGAANVIKVIGVGGGGSNAVNNMYQKGIVGVDFAVLNTDNQALEMSPVNTKVQLGPTLTDGRGAGSKPNIGREACLESEEEVKALFGDDTKMVFITAGMGGGTGTGAAPVLAKAAQEMDILTVGIVTMPFSFEGRRRQNQAAEGLAEFKKHVDTLIVISNDKLRQIHGNLSLTSAFGQADNILTTAAKSIAEIITVPGYVNVDFEDVNTVMRGSGVAIMGTATIEGEDRAQRAVEAALTSPLLEDNDIQGAEHILLNITSGTEEVTMDEIFQITEYVQERAGRGTDLIWGNCFDEKLGEKLTVTVIATGFDRKNEQVAQEEPKEEPKPEVKPKQKPIFVSLDDKAPDNSRPSFSNPQTYEVKKPQAPANQPQTPRRSAEELQQVHNMHVKLTNPHTLNMLENEPAYVRRNVLLDDVPHSSEETLSKLSLSEDNDGNLRENNNYYDGHVD